MKNVIGAVLVSLFAVAGGVGGQALQGGSDGSDHSAESADDGHGGGHDAKEDDHGEKKKDDGHGGGHGSDAGYGSDVRFFNFNREFVIPIMANQRVDSLIIININLEVQASVLDKLFSLKPKLRDNIMTTLVELSNDGHTLVEPTSVDSYETIRSTVMLNLGSVVDKGIENVLIMDLAKQDL
ncbi:MAG: hypothetical protein ABJG15_01315 [Hyphomonadaceae bacterium]